MNSSGYPPTLQIGSLVEPVKHPPLGAEIDLLFRNGPGIESARQWMLIIFCSILVALCLHAVRRVYKTQRQFTQDSLLIFLEAIKIILYSCYEFLFSHLIILLMVFMIQSVLRAVVCANFFTKSLVISNRQHMQNLFIKTYYGLIVSLYALIIVLALTTAHSINCDSSMYSYHWFMLDSVDMFQSVLIVISAVFIVRHMKVMIKEEMHIRTSVTPTQITTNESNEEVAYQDQQKNALKQQTIFLAGSYLFFVASDFLMMALGNALFSLGVDFECLNEIEVAPKNNSGALFLLVYSLLLMSFSAMIWFVLYKIPDNHGLISKRGNKEAIAILMDGKGSTSVQLDDNAQSALQDFISITKEEEIITPVASSPRANDIRRQTTDTNLFGGQKQNRFSLTKVDSIVRNSNPHTGSGTFYPHRATTQNLKSENGSSRQQFKSQLLVEDQTDTQMMLDEDLLDHSVALPIFQNLNSTDTSVENGAGAAINRSYVSESTIKKGRMANETRNKMHRNTAKNNMFSRATGGNKYL